MDHETWWFTYRRRLWWLLGTGKLFDYIYCVQIEIYLIIIWTYKTENIVKMILFRMDSVMQIM